MLLHIYLPDTNEAYNLAFPVADIQVPSGFQLLFTSLLFQSETLSCERVSMYALRVLPVGNLLLLSWPLRCVGICQQLQPDLKRAVHRAFRLELNAFQT